MDIEKLRKETKGVGNVVHFNNAGASLMPVPVFNAIASYHQDEVEWGGYEVAGKMRSELEAAYDSVAKLINAQREEIALLENATAAWAAIFHAIPLKAGDEILTCEAEYASNYISYLQAQKKLGLEIRVIPNDHRGALSIEAAQQMISNRTKLISVTHMPTNGGLVNPAEELGVIAREHGILYLLDACQSVGHYPVDVEKIGCDFLSATGRKYLRGPRGTGFLYIKRTQIENFEPIVLDLHSAEWITKTTYKVKNDARRFENWEANMALRMGIKAAADYANDLGINSIWERTSLLAQKMRESFATVRGLKIRDLGAVMGGIVTFTLEGYSPEEIKEYLSRQGINVTVTFKGSTLLDMENRNLESMVRASVHYYNTEEEIDFCRQQLETMVMRDNSNDRGSKGV